MLQGFDAIVSQKLSEPIAPVHRQDGHERIELLGAARLRVEMGAGTLPLTMVSLPVFVRARAVDVAEIATWIEPVAQATFERLGVGKAAIGLALPNRLAVASDFEDAAGSRREPPRRDRSRTSRAAPARARPRAGASDTAYNSEQRSVV
jgi:hypothetical protein